MFLNHDLNTMRKAPYEGYVAYALCDKEVWLEDFI